MARRPCSAPPTVIVVCYFLFLLFLFCLVSCGGSAPVPARDIAFTVKPSSAEAKLTYQGAVIPYSPEANGHLVFHVPEGVPTTATGELHLTASGYLESIFATLPLCCGELPALELVGQILPRLLPMGGSFVQDTGDRFTVIGNNEHQLYEKFLHKPDEFTAVITQRKSIGFNWLRVASMCTDGPGGPPCFASFDDDYYNRLPEFAQRLANDGFYLELTAFIGTARFMPDPDQQLSHWNRIIERLAPSTNVLLELVNENDIGSNHIDAARFPWPNLPLSSHGSNGSQHIAFRPPWSYETFHTNDAFEWWRKSHNAMELSEGAEGLPASRVPVVVDEKTRYPDGDICNGGPTPCTWEAALHHAYDDAAIAALLAAGSSFHSNHGRFSELFDDAELQAAHEMVAGARSIPLYCQLPPYFHNSNEEGPNDLRLYHRGNDPACTARARRK